MTLSVTHTFVSGIADDPTAAAAGEVLPSHWNAGHTLTGLADLTTQVTGILPAANGGTANGFFAVSGPLTTTKTFTLPNASAVILTDNAAVTVAQGGTGAATFTAHGVLVGEGTSAFAALSVGATGTLLAGATGADPAFSATPTLGANSGTGGALTFKGSTSGSVALQVAAAAGTGTIFQLPATNGTSGWVLQTDGNGVTSWVAAAGGSPAGASLTLQYNNASSFGGMSGSSWDDTNRALTLTGATVTASNPILNLTQTWNNGAVAFTGIQLNVTKTASAAASKLVDIQIAGTSVAYVDATGGVFGKTGSSNVPGLSFANDPTYGFYALHSANIIGLSFGLSNDIIFTNNDIRIRSDSAAYYFGSGDDLVIRRAAAATLQHGGADAAAPVAQIVQAQSVVAGTSNTAGVDFTLQGSRGTGTGVGGNIVFKAAPAGSTGTAQNAASSVLTVRSDKTIQLNASFTVSTLPTAGAQGRKAYVTDATAPTFLGTLTGGGSVVCPVFDNGTAWVAG